MFHCPVSTIHHPTQQIMAPALVTLHKARYTAAVASRVSPGKTASLYSSSPWSQGVVTGLLISVLCLTYKGNTFKKKTRKLIIKPNRLVENIT